MTFRWLIALLIVSMAMLAPATAQAGSCTTKYPQIEKLNKRFPAHGVGAAAFRMSPRGVRVVAEYAGFSPRQAAIMEQISRGESGHYPGIVSWDRGYGLWQNTPRVWYWTALAYLRKLGGTGALLNPVKNARMARWLYLNGGLGHWYGTRYLNPAAVPTSVDSVLRKVRICAVARVWRTS